MPEFDSTANRAVASPIAASALPPMQFRDLPLQARCALEYFDTQSRADRSAELLDRLLDHYHRVYGMDCEASHRQWCHAYVIERYRHEPLQ